MALVEAFGELWESARGLKNRSSGTIPTGGSHGPSQPRLILIETPLMTSKQLPAHENTTPLICSLFALLPCSLCRDGLALVEKDVEVNVL